MMKTNLNEWVQEELQYAISKVKENMNDFYDKVLPAASRENRFYPEDAYDWTASFWVGILQLAKEYEQNQEYDEIIEAQLNLFKQRLDQRIALDTHDLGFLYSLSAVADFKLTGNQDSKILAIRAADELMVRYFPKAEIIQAWGDLNDINNCGRMIIDCLMNLPLLYTASQWTGDTKYQEAAYAHAKQTAKYMVRQDYTTFHTYYMDVETGEPRFGSTQQGYSDDSCWARGQAWGIYGFTLSYRYTGDSSFLELAEKLADYFIAHLPDDLICYWDLIFTTGDEQRDSSAAAIAVCGLLELSKQLPLSNPKKDGYNQIAVNILGSLSETYTTQNDPEANGILLHSVYDKKSAKGVDEMSSWGDYFYLEALVRLYKAWNLYW